MAELRSTRTAAGTRTAQIDEGLRAHMNKVYGTMSVGLLFTALVAWAIGTMVVSSTPTEYMLREGQYLTQLGYSLFASPLKWVIMFLPLVMVFAFSATINRLSAAGAQLFFYVFAAAMGLSISWIFVVFTDVSIASTFLATAAAFAGLSLWGYTTKKDISGWGSFLIMGVVGLIVASIINIFLQSEMLAWTVSFLGVLIFAGLTAYDTQRIKTDYIQHAQAMDGEWLAKSAIMGALNLYLDFINLFMFLLQFMGSRE
ncbi:MAG TPA: BAX inhibitor (BI)-1/YccA family protein [Rhodobacteraceae bacterium]|mgnify:CR=1 FL=1|nr:BAX inhibitor (BI)-1/YccA family protein [Paracoccaceae bacterium]